MSTHQLESTPRNPVLEKHERMRGQKVSNRIADVITSFAGSMVFVYVHVVWFAVWVVVNEGGLGRSAEFDRFPFGLLTMIVSLEAIFLSTFLLISQNRQDERRAMLADAEWALVQKQEKENELEVQQNRQLLGLSNQIYELSQQIRDLTVAHTRPAAPGGIGGGGPDQR